MFDLSEDWKGKLRRGAQSTMNNFAPSSGRNGELRSRLLLDSLYRELA